MQRTPTTPFLPDIETPLRDAMRGIARFSEATEEALEPAARLLPEPLREGFREAIRSIETTGKSWVDRALEQDQIVSASGFAMGHRVEPAAARDFAKVLCVAWERLEVSRYMISETILRNRVAQASPQASGADFAASLLEAIRSSSAIGFMPGVAEGIGAKDRREIDLALVAIMLWLLAARSDSVSEEFSVLDLSMALVTAIANDVLSAMDDRAKMSDLLQSSSEHL